MRIIFRIHYNTVWGEQLFVSGNTQELGAWNADRAAVMNHLGNGWWELEIDSSEHLEYKYFVKDGTGNVRWEYGVNRKMDSMFQNKEVLLICDAWSVPDTKNKALATSAFTKSIMAPDVNDFQVKRYQYEKNIVFCVEANRMNKEHQLCMLGSSMSLGAWNQASVKLMNYDSKQKRWVLEVEANQSENLEYKYGVYHKKTKTLLFLEEGANRSLTFDFLEQRFQLLKNDEAFRYPLSDWKGAGVCVPVFSLRSENGHGTGEFVDLIDFIDWAKDAGLKMVQILPINETIASHSWGDSYPYKAISTIALHPLYLNLQKMGSLNDKNVQMHFDQRRGELNASSDVQYVDVMEDKSRYFKLLYDQEKEAFLADRSFAKFFENNKEWLVPYAAFAFLRDKYKTADFRQWKEYFVFNRTEIEQLCAPDNSWYDDIAIHYFIQYHLDKQMSEVADYARKKGVVLKGDIPIGISPQSVEAWTEPHLFNMNGQAGAPPDDFSAEGQNWGFPTYNWEVMAKDNYAWWRKRLTKMAEYFDAYRIDHLLGFFRIWEVPTNQVHALLGYFRPSLPYSEDDLRNMGIQFDEERMCKPYIRECILDNLFGELKEGVKQNYLIDRRDGRYDLRENFDTQEKINAHFLQDCSEEELQGSARTIRDGLFYLCNNVLFVRYPYTAHTSWVPGISIHRMESYRDLDAVQKSLVNDLYNDFFYKRHDDFWYQEAMKRLPALMNATDMLVCGEDLGMIPDCVHPLMKKLGILSLEIQRMPKDPKKQYAHPADAPYLSVCTTSTHDMSTIRGWWEEEREAMQCFFTKELGNEGNAPYFAEPWVCVQMIKQHLYSPAMWVTIPIQDYLSMDGDLRWDETHKERINVPSNVRHKWRFRMKQSISELKMAKGFNKSLKEMIIQTERYTDF